ncbi:DMT family transporter [Celeribacter neptunius]|uniref:Permease of the drug/metabolite transporter (DMT) superfamily n=1 Tax=Celeribacter neptunius TaxID=588602 RepID=A0A1I3K4J7_9RHOB|nr:DMT family transporter [Celeribacter neptunius]SFI67230.1 Permease of the drug/metabolite transporter (DMT) superfamily [Celeribacter neptunius]
MHNLRAILMIIGAMAFFTVEDMVIKHLTGYLPVGQVLLCVALGGGTSFFLWALLRRDAILARQNWRPMVVLRASTEAVASLSFVTALSRVDVSTVGAVFQSMPLAVTMGAALFLGEKVGWRRWAAMCVGFLGVLLIIRPGLSGFNPQVLWVLVAVVAVATRDLMTRVIDATVPSSVVSLQAFLTVITAAALTLIASGERMLPLNAPSLGLIALATTGGAIGYALIVAGMRLGDASTVTPFRYTRLVFTMIGGVLIFGERPDAMTLAGATLIILSGLYTFLRERKLARLAQAPLSQDTSHAHPEEELQTHGF